MTVQEIADQLCEHLRETEYPKCLNHNIELPVEARGLEEKVAREMARRGYEVSLGSKRIDVVVVRPKRGEE